jgi:hypothetical protein
MIALEKSPINILKQYGLSFEKFSFVPFEHSKYVDTET